MASLDELKKKLAGDKPEPMVIANNSKIHSKGIENKVDRRHFNKRPPGSGRKKSEKTIIAQSFKAWMDAHAHEKVMVEVLDRKTGRVMTIEKPRMAYAMEKLFALATKGEGNADAIEKWISRFVGKAAQPIRGDGEDDAPIKIGVDVGDILRKAYGKSDE